MKTILVSFLFVMGFSSAMAATEYVSGNGYASGFCRGDGFASLCVRQLEERAESDSARDADIQCSYKRGTLLRYTASCYTNCNPPFVPINGDTFVNCSARCNFQCDIRTP